MFLVWVKQTNPNINRRVWLAGSAGDSVTRVLQYPAHKTPHYFYVLLHTLNSRYGSDLSGIWRSQLPPSHAAVGVRIYCEIYLKDGAVAMCDWGLIRGSFRVSHV